MRLLYILILSTIFYSLSNALKNIKTDFLSQKYEKRVMLGPQYEVFWKITGNTHQDKILHLALHVETAGWIGFGLAKFPTNGMGGSDILIGNVTGGSIVIEDRYAVGNQKPIMDECQDWVLVAGEEAVYDEKVYTTIEVTRKLISADVHQDNPIEFGYIQVIWAFGIDDTFQYHGLNRMPTSINFYDINQIDLTAAGILTHDIRVTNYSGPIIKTFYGCQSFVLPYSDTKLYDIIAIEPLHATNNSIGVHHFNLVTCEANDTWWYNRTKSAENCNSPTQSNCINNIYAAGSSNPNILYLPQNVGYRMGEGYYKYVYLQVHYDNPKSLPWVDDTGVRIYYTANLRQHSAAGIVLGDVQIRGKELPPQQPWIDRQYNCPSECLSRNNESMKVVGAFLHAHLAATQIYAYIKRVEDGVTKKIMIIRDQFFKFGWQYVGSVTPIEIRPTDDVVVRCVYSTMDRQNATLMGLNSADEMCNVILFYYMENNNHPTMSVCGYYRNKTSDETSTLCGQRNSFIFQPNPKVVEPLEESYRTWGNVTFVANCENPQNLHAKASSNSNNNSLNPIPVTHGHSQNPPSRKR